MWDLEDAVFSANNLGENGAPSGNMETALHQYNHSQAYISEVMKYATLYVTEGYDAITIPQPGKAVFSRPVNGQVTFGLGSRIHPATGEVEKRHEHHEDGKTMILVQKEIHRDFRHIGGQSTVNGENDYKGE